MSEHNKDPNQLSQPETEENRSSQEAPVWTNPNTEAWLLGFLRALVKENRPGDRHEIRS